MLVARILALAVNAINLSANPPFAYVTIGSIPRPTPQPSPAPISAPAPIPHFLDQHLTNFHQGRYLEKVSKKLGWGRCGTCEGFEGMWSPAFDHQALRGSVSGLVKASSWVMGGDESYYLITLVLVRIGILADDGDRNTGNLLFFKCERFACSAFWCACTLVHWTWITIHIYYRRCNPNRSHHCIFFFVLLPENSCRNGNGLQVSSQIKICNLAGKRVDISLPIITFIHPTKTSWRPDITARTAISATISGVKPPMGNLKIVLSIMLASDWKFVSVTAPGMTQVTPTPYPSSSRPNELERLLW